MRKRNNGKFVNQYDFLTKEILLDEMNKTKSKKKIIEKYGFTYNTLNKYIENYNINFTFERRKYICDESIFSEDNETSFYLAGFIAADGNLSKDKRTIQIILADKDISHLENIRNLFKFQTEIPFQKMKSANWINANGTVCNRQSASRLAFKSSRIYEDLYHKFNITPNKSLSLKFPNRIFNSSLVNHFIRGYFDGDGSVNKTKFTNSTRMNFELVGTKNMMENIQKILMIYCNASKNKIYKDGNVYRLKYNGNGIVSDIYDFLYKNANIFLERKQSLMILAKEMKVRARRGHKLFK